MWPLRCESLALWVMIPLRFWMWLRRRKFVLLLDIGELHAVAGWDCDEVADGAMLCWTTV